MPLTETCTETQEPLETSSARKTWPNGYKSRFLVVRDPNDGVLYPKQVLAASGRAVESDDESGCDSLALLHQEALDRLPPYQAAAIAFLQLAQIGTTLVRESINIGAIGLRCNLTSLWFILRTNFNVIWNLLGIWGTFYYGVLCSTPRIGLAIAAYAIYAVASWLDINVTTNKTMSVAGNTDRRRATHVRAPPEKSPSPNPKGSATAEPTDDSHPGWVKVACADVPLVDSQATLVAPMTESTQWDGDDEMPALIQDMLPAMETVEELGEKLVSPPQSLSRRNHAGRAILCGLGRDS